MKNKIQVLKETGVEVRIEMSSRILESLNPLNRR